MSYDGNTKISWTQCVWWPKAIRNNVTLRKIERLRAISKNLIELHYSRVNQDGLNDLTAAQRIQLRDRGYNV
jgi:hypothetical protein